MALMVSEQCHIRHHILSHPLSRPLGWGILSCTLFSPSGPMICSIWLPPVLGFQGNKLYDGISGAVISTPCMMHDS